MTPKLLIPIIIGGAVGKLLKAKPKPKPCTTKDCRKDYPEDRATKNTQNRSADFNSEGEARALAREKLGRDPVDLGDNKLRSQDGVWQYRAKPGDVGQNHVHLERLNPSTGEVLENWHLRWPAGRER